MSEDSLQEPWRRWIPVIDRLLWQAYYRILSFISFHAPVGESYQAAQELSGTRGGEVYWVVPDRVFRWDDVEVSPGIRMTVWIFGSALRGKNSVIARRGFWALYLFDTYVKGMARVLRVEKEG